MKEKKKANVTPYWLKFKLCHFAHVFICFGYSNWLFVVEYFQRKISNIWPKWTNPFPYVFNSICKFWNSWPISVIIFDGFVAFFSSVRLWTNFLRNKFSSILPIGACLQNVHWQTEQEENLIMPWTALKLAYLLQFKVYEWPFVVCFASEFPLVSSSWCISGLQDVFALCCIHRANRCKFQFYYIVIMDKAIFGQWIGRSKCIFQNSKQFE